MSPTEQCFVVLLLTGVGAPVAGLLLRRVSGGWNSVGKGRFAIEPPLPSPRGAGRPAPRVDPAIQAAEVRQMLAAKSARRQRRGEAPLDIEAETKRLLAPGAVEAETERQLADFIGSR